MYNIDMGQKEYKNQTFSLPIEVTVDLHAYIKRREMSRFVAEAIRKELELKKNQLKQAYISANKDLGQIASMEDWNETIADGSDDW